jgi:hypothetical protein
MQPIPFLKKKSTQNEGLESTQTPELILTYPNH